MQSKTSLAMPASLPALLCGTTAVRRLACPRCWAVRRARIAAYVLLCLGGCGAWTPGQVLGAGSVDGTIALLAVQNGARLTTFSHGEVGSSRSVSLSTLRVLTTCCCSGGDNDGLQRHVTILVQRVCPLHQSTRGCFHLVASHRFASHPVCLCNNVLAAHRAVACRYGTCDKPRSEKAVPRSRSRCTAPLHLWPASRLISTRNRWQRRVARRSSCTT